MSLGENMKAARKAAGLSQYALAELIGCRQGDIVRYEQDKVVPSAVMLKNICIACHVSADRLLEIDFTE